MRIQSLYSIVTIGFLFFAQVVGVAQETGSQHDTIPEGYRRSAGPCEPVTGGTVPFEETLQKAKAGDLESQFGVFWLYRQCNDYENALKWCRTAANAGHTGGQLYMGYHYLEGKEGVPQDYNEAIKWFTKAAKQKSPVAQIELGWMYYNGQGVPKDFVQAYKWFNLAAANAPPNWWYANPADTRDGLAKLMTPSQIAEAQRLSSEFSPKKQNHPTTDAHAQAKAEIKGSGTGFFITADGYLLTAYHVVKEADSIQIWTNKGLKPASIVRADTVNDIALLKVDGIQCEALAVQSSRGVKVGAEVFTLGFPNIQLQGTEAKYTNGHINSLSGFADDPRLFQISAAIQPGNSGGPLLRPDGTVVGIVVAKLDEIATANTTGSLPQNVNYALKSSFVLSFLEALPELSGKLSPVGTPNLPQTQTVEKAAKSVAMVLCY
jgi:S1-C subfamily serine protease